MLVQVALRDSESAQVRERIVGLVQRAIQEALGFDAARIFVQLTLGLDGSKGAGACRTDEIRVAVLVIASQRLGGATKRKLFGRIAEISRLELNIAHDQIVTGIIESSLENWSDGYGERQWLQYLAYQLP